MSLGLEQSEYSNRKRPHSANVEVKLEHATVVSPNQIDLMHFEAKKPQEFLPDLDDPGSIDAFFRRSRRQRSPAHEASEGTLPNNHPMKKSVEQPENREMSVKEALARGFRNYRVRLPKVRRVLAPTEFQPGTFIPEVSFEATCSGVDHSLPSTSQATLNLLPDDSLLLTEPTPTNLNEMLASTYTIGDIMDFGKNSKKSIDYKEHDEQNLHIPTESDLSINYPLPPFWQLNPYVSKGYKGGFYVQGNKYVQVTTLIQNYQLFVSLNEPITFEIDEKPVVLTMKELFAANGIIIRNEKSVEQLQVSIHNPIVLSETIPPFACYQLPLFLMSLGTQFGDNEILDKSHFSANTGNPASRSVSPDHLLNPIHPHEQEPTTSTALITKEEPEEVSLSQKLLVVSSVLKGTAVTQIAESIGISRKLVEIIFENQSNIQQVATPMFIEESREEAVVRKITQNMNNINEQSQIRIMESPPKELRTIKKNRVRRTSFVGLNVLMWRFFRECADNNIPLNGKQLKEHAMIIARKLGLDQFKGSEGWLDAFKRRHKIDLKQMTGNAANYEDEGIEETTNVRMEPEEIGNEEEHNSAESHRSSPLYFSSNTNAVASTPEGTGDVAIVTTWFSLAFTTNLVYYRLTDRIHNFFYSICSYFSLNRYCRRSCGFCQSNDNRQGCHDRHISCAFWRAQNYCTRRRQWMAENCQASCGWCAMSQQQLCASVARISRM